MSHPTAFTWDAEARVMSPKWPILAASRFEALRDKHREKTAQDVAVKSKTARMRAKHLGIWPKSKTRWPTRKLGVSRPQPQESH